ncbi:MAG: response regulator [Actinobacteria bacterium]|nr:response regulator [Actinomycetota bacterium]
MTTAKIFIVGDDMIVARDIQLQLENFGFSVPAIVPSGKKSFEKIKKLKPDLVLMDIMLNGTMDGIETTDQIHSRFHIPVVFLTAYSDPKVLERAKTAELFGYIIKPFETRELYAVIEMALYKHKVERMLQKAHDELEQRIAERTVDLEEANKQLKQEVESRKLAQKALSESEKRFRTIFEKAVEGILVTYFDTKKIKYANASICNMLGYTEKELQQMEIKAIHPKDALEYVISEFESHTKEEKTYSPDIPCLKKDGTVIYTDLTGTTAYIDGRKCFIGFFTDITEKKKMEEQLILSCRLEALGRLVDRFSHEIKNPLTGINLYVDILKDKFKFSAWDEEILDDIMFNVNKINKTVRKAIAFANPSVGDSQELDINALIREEIDLWSETFKTAKIRLESHFEDDIPQIFGNPVELQQILGHLVKNGVSAMEKGGVLNITTNKRTSKFHRNCSMVIIKVKDTGSGIKPEHKEKILHPFFTTKTGCTGLGLSISHTIVEQHGGYLSCDSEPGKGTTFTIELPLNNS